MNSKIKFKVIWVDEGDGTIQFEGFFANELSSTTLAFYGYSDEFMDFANQLTEFPKTSNHRVTYELGERGNNWAYYLLIQAYCVEVNGHSALKIEVVNYGSGPSHYESKFEISLEPASVNRLGQNLKAWNPIEEKYFEWVLKE